LFKPKPEVSPALLVWIALNVLEGSDFPKIDVVYASSGVLVFG
jgi:hypothetical protein